MGVRVAFRCIVILAMIYMLCEVLTERSVTQ